ncbi:MAG TPA: YdeI/OmpD-associated family protein [Jiangellales bacterium]|nr:YdeI/OmpD-associated family protein [Jiangellales bacterium]
MKFRAYVEPAEPMRGLEIPADVVEALGGGKRPPVTITVNRHTWKSRIAILRGRYLLGLSNANRQAAGVVTGDEVEVELELDAEPRVVIEPADFARALDADPVARAAYDRLSDSHKREHVRAIESAKRPETRQRRIEKAVTTLRGPEPTRGGAARAATRATTPTGTSHWSSTAHAIMADDPAASGLGLASHVGRCKVELPRCLA